MNSRVARVRDVPLVMLGLFVGSMAAAKPEMRVQVVSAVDPCRGLRVRKGDTVHITHQGFLEEDDGKLGDAAVVTRRQIDSNCAPGVENCEPLAFTVGAKLIIRGMERAVVGVCQGETIEAHIPPHLAYDDPARTIPADTRPVPENAWVVYRITVERIERPGSPGERSGQLGGFEPWQVGGAAVGIAALVFVLWRAAGPARGGKSKRKKKGK
jgi:hypothetical protein